MAKVSVQEIKELMKSTGVGMMDCKKALEANDGDMDKAIEFLREKGLATQAKKSGRAAAEGVVTAVVEGNVGVLLEVNTETDFAANTDDIKNFVSGVAKTIIDNNPADVDALKEMTISGGTATVGEVLTELAGMKIRENTLTDLNLITPGSLYSEDVIKNTYSRFSALRPGQGRFHMWRGN